MPLGHWDVEWLNLNSQRAYPLADHATARDQSGSFTLPRSFLLACYFPVHAGLNVAVSRFFVRRVAVAPTGYTVSIGYDDGSTYPIVATAVIARSTHAEYDSYALPGLGDFDDSTGKLVIGSLDDIDLQPAGEFTFTPAGGALDTDCVRPMIRGVSSVVVINGDDRSPRIYGDIELVASTNVEITVALVDGATEIRISAAVGLGGGGGGGSTAGAGCDCVDESDLPPCIRTINGIAPTPAGDFTLLGNDCIEITGIDHGLSLADACSKPCCGCTELEEVTEQLQHLSDEAITLRNHYSVLAAQVATMELNVLGSRLNDEACLTN